MPRAKSTAKPKAKPKAKMGRPTTYDETYPDQIRELGKEGLTRAQISVRLGIPWSTWSEWADPSNPRFKPDFSDAIKQAMITSMAVVEAEVAELMKQPSSTHSATLILFRMKNQFREFYGDHLQKVPKDDDSGTTVNVTIDGKAFGKADAED